MTIIRVATAQDAVAIEQLSQGLGYPSASHEQAHARLQQLLDSNCDWVWVAEHQKNLLGWIHAFEAHRLASSAFIEIGGLVVGEQTRRQGVGRALVEQVRLTATERGLPVRVRCNARRQGAHAFYADMGFCSTKSQVVFDS